MSTTEYLIDTNILIYHTEGSEVVCNFIKDALAQKAFNVSVLTKIEFLGWDKHTLEGFEKSRRLVELSQIYPVSQEVADTAIDLRRKRMIKMADAVIAATAIVNNMQLATRNVNDFRGIASLTLINPFE